MSEEAKEITLRPYQQECTEVIEEKGEGKWLVAVATGLGKTVIMSHMKRHGRMLILSHRDELVRQPEKYFDCSFGIEKADEHSNGEDVVSASVQSLSRDSRLERYSPDDFETIVVDEAHHASAPTYRKILDYFSGAKRRIGFTATPKRGDGVGLAGIFDEIIYIKDLKWGIENGYLSRIRAIRVTADYKLDKVKKTAGDYNQKQLEEVLAMSEAPVLAAKTYVQECHNAGRHTIIYCVTRKICRQVQESILNLIPEEEADTVRVLTGLTESEERKEILSSFMEGKVRCIINPLVLTEGTDLPICDCIINMRPTCNPSLYVQIAGRGSRLYEGKEYSLLIDIAPEGKAKSLCTAPTLFGIDPDKMSQKQAARVSKENDLLDLCMDISQACADLEKRIQLRIEAMDLFLEEHEAMVKKNKDKGLKSLAQDIRANKEKKREEAPDYDFLGLSVEVQADEAKFYKIKVSWNEAVYLSKPDVLGNTTADFFLYLSPNAKGVPIRRIGTLKMEDAIRLVRGFCETQRESYAYIWDTGTQKSWASAAATEKQQGKAYYCYKADGISSKEYGRLNKLEANDLINTALEVKEKKKERAGLMQAAKAFPNPYDLSGKEHKATKTATDAKEREEKKEQQQALAIQKGKKEFASFASAINKNYAELLSYREKLAKEQEKNQDENGLYIPVEAAYYCKARTLASPRQVAYVNSLLSAARERGDRFQKFDTGTLTKRQASGMIAALLHLQKNYQAEEGGRDFFYLGKLLNEFETAYGPKNFRMYYKKNTPS